MGSNAPNYPVCAGRAFDRDFYLDMLSAITKPEMAKGYRLRMERHRAVYSEFG